MSRDESGWGWFDNPADGTAADSSEAEAADPARTFARCFTTAEGARVLRHLRLATLERSLAPDVPDRVVRHLEGQRHLVRCILSLVRRGCVEGHAATELLNASVGPDGHGELP